MLPPPPPIRMTLHGPHETLELFSDRVVVRPTGWLSRLLPMLFGEARMAYLDEVRDVCLVAVRFQPVVEFRIVISSIYQTDLCATCFEADYVTACRMVDYIEAFMEQRAFQPPPGS